MINGDIDNRVAPRLLLVFEGLIGRHETRDDTLKFRMWDKVGQKKRAIRTFTLDDHTLRWAWDAAYRHHLPIDVFTYLLGYSEQIEERLDAVTFPYGVVLEATPSEASRFWANSPSIAAVFDPDPSRQFLYGAKSRAILTL